MNDELKQRLDAIVRAGGTITLPSGVTLPLAAAFLAGKRFWFCELWPRDDFAQHWLEIEAAQPLYQGAMIALTLADGRAVVAPMDAYERADWRWDLWLTQTTMAEFVSGLKARAVFES